MYVSVELFRRTVRVLVALRAAGAVRLLLGSSVYLTPVQFELLRDHPKVEATLAEEDLTLDEVDSAAPDIADGLALILTGWEEADFVQFRADPERWGNGEGESEDVAREKYEILRQSFDLEELERRYWVKSTSKNQLPSRLEWEVSVKQADDAHPRPAGTAITFATVRFATVPDPRLPFVSEGREVIMTMDAEDVAFVLDSFERLKAEMTKTEPTKELEDGSSSGTP